MRLAITGSAGTGKSTLSEALGHSLSLPVIPEGMREYLERTGLDLHDVGYDGLRQLVLALWSEREALELGTPGFVADRCSVDFAAFWLFYRFEGHPDTAEHQARFAAHAARYDRVVILPHGGLPLEADGVRSPNPWTQLRYQLILEGMLARTVAPERLLRLPPGCRDLASRVAWIRRAITP